MGLRYPVHSGSAFVGRDCRGGHPAHHAFQRAGHGQYSLGLGKGTIYGSFTVGRERYHDANTQKSAGICR